MTTTPPAITALPSAPDPNNRTTFNTLAYPWSAALPTFGTQVSAVGANVKANADEVIAATDAVMAAGLATAAANATTASTAATTATTQAGIATTKASEANASAIAAAASVASIAGGPVASVNGMTGVVTGLGDVTLAGAQTLVTKTHTSPRYTRDDDGTVMGGVWAIDYANGPVIKAVAGANISSITIANWPTSGTAGHLKLMLNAAGFTITFPAWKWIKSDLTLTTVFADLKLTLPSGIVLIDLFTEDGGTNVYATVARG